MNRSIHAPEGLLDPVDELRNFERIAEKINPSEQKIPRLDGVDVHGAILPLRGVIGGDHIVYVDFNRRYDLDARIKAARARGRSRVARELRRKKRRAGILIADVSGHRVTDAVVAAMLHQSFLLGVLYELDLSGGITTRLFEHLNTRFFKTSSVDKYFTMLYGEISEEGRFRFLSAAHEPPVVFSREHRKLVGISRNRIISFPPIGVLPSGEDQDQTRENGLYGYKKRYTINEVNLLAPGDILLLHTDGFSGHARGRFFPAEVEKCFRKAGRASAREISMRLEERIASFGPQSDDIAFVVIKKR